MSDDADKIAFRYDPERNPDRAALPGVPLRSLRVRDVAAQPAWIVASIRAQPFYIATQYAPKADPDAADDAPATEEPARRAGRRRADAEEAPAAEG